MISFKASASGCIRIDSAESIRMHPDADALKEIMLGVGFDEVETHRMSGGIVALHIGIKY